MVGLASKLRLAHGSPTPRRAGVAGARAARGSSVLGFPVVGFLVIGALLLAGACSTPEAEPEIAVVEAPVDELVPPGGTALRITADARLAPGEHAVSAAGDDGVLLLEGLDGVTLDLNGARLSGAPDGTTLDRMQGRAIVVRGSTNVTIRNGAIGGYKGCIVVEDSSGVVVEDVRFEGWYGMRLRSTIAAEDGADWLWPHENDHGEWLSKYGGAISITGGAEHVVRRCSGRKGQNGILLTRVERAEVYDNDFSFLSGWGLAMYRSSENVVSHNAFDYCVRGYSHDVYWRGQDSAGILMFERCSRNLVAYNSATHGGDGVFLFAGNDLVEGRAVARGEPPPGGSDRNVFLGNDLRFAVANALEATFSDDNIVIENDLSGCRQHGIWGGYSKRMVILDNRIEGVLGGGITIEHGEECYIADNRIGENEIGVELYWDDDPQFVEGPLAKHRTTDSENHWIIGNAFRDNVQDLVLSHTTGIVVHGNDWLPGNRDTYIKGLDAADDPTRGASTVRAWLLDLEGRCPSGNLQNVTLAPWTGERPDPVRAWSSWKAPPVPGTLAPRAEDRGHVVGGLETIVIGEFGPWDHRSGEPRPEPRKPGGLLEDATWAARWFRWEEGASDPRTALEVWRARAAEPIVAADVPTFVDPYGGNDRVRRSVGNDLFGLVASTDVALAEGGAHRLVVVSDDGVRVSIDGRVVFEDWTHHGPTREEVEVELAPGEHRIDLEYFQIRGAYALLVELERAE